MEASFHGYDVLVTELSEDQLAGMSLYGRDRKVGYVLIGKLITVSYL